MKLSLRITIFTALLSQQIGAAGLASLEKKPAKKSGIIQRTDLTLQKQWSISLDELQQSLAEPQTTLRHKAAAAIAGDHKLLCQLGELYDDLNDTIAKAWFKRNYTALYERALQKTKPIELRSDFDPVAFLPNGNILAKEYNRIGIVDGSTGANILTFDTNPISSLVALPNGNIASGHYDGTVNMWDSSTGKLINTFSDKNPATALAVLPDGNLAVGCTRAITILDGVTGKFIHNIDLGGNSWDTITALAGLPNGHIVIGFKYGDAAIVDSGTGKIIYNLFHDQIPQPIKEKLDMRPGYYGVYGVSSLNVLPNGYIVILDRKGFVSVWDSATGKLIHTINTDLNNDYIQHVAVVPHSSTIITSAHNNSITIITSTHNNSITIWDGVTGENKGNFKEVDYKHMPYNAMAISLEGDIATSTSFNHPLGIFIALWKVSKHFKDLFPDAHNITMDDICYLDAVLNPKK